MRWRMKSGALCALLACASIVMAEGQPRYKSAADETKEVPQLAEGVLSSSATMKAAQVLATLPKSAAAVQLGAAEAVEPEATPRASVERLADGTGFYAHVDAQRSAAAGRREVSLGGDRGGDAGAVSGRRAVQPALRDVGRRRGRRRLLRSRIRVHQLRQLLGRARRHQRAELVRHFHGG